MIPKFRVWDKKTKSMLNIESWHVEDEYFDLIEPDKNVADPSANRVWRKESDVILMQSTGLFDKNGKEIFEGDVLASYRKESEIVGHGYTELIEVTNNFQFIFDGQHFLVKGVRKENWISINKKEVYEVDDYFTAHNLITEVVGNIYENHDLLESVEE